MDARDRERLEFVDVEIVRQVVDRSLPDLIGAVKRALK